MHRYLITMQHDETLEQQGWSLVASSFQDAIAKAQCLAGGGRWRFFSGCAIL